MTAMGMPPARQPRRMPRRPTAGVTPQAPAAGPAGPAQQQTRAAMVAALRRKLGGAMRS